MHEITRIDISDFILFSLCTVVLLITGDHERQYITGLDDSATDHSAETSA